MRRPLFYVPVAPLFSSLRPMLLTRHLTIIVDNLSQLGDLLRQSLKYCSTVPDKIDEFKPSLHDLLIDDSIKTARLMMCNQMVLRRISKKSMLQTNWKIKVCNFSFKTSSEIISRAKNVYPVSYTHLDVYKRQVLQYCKKIHTVR